MDDDLRRIEEDPQEQNLPTEHTAKFQSDEDINTFRVMTVVLVHKYYPSLLKMVQRRVDELHTVEDLSTLCRSVAKYFEEKNEPKVRELLRKPRPQPKSKSK